MNRGLTLTFSLASLLLATPPPSPAAEPEAGLFPFSLPSDDVTEGVTDLSFLNNRPADDLVTVRDGHFFAGRARIRFWGVCIIGMEAFPSHEDAVLLARRLACRGFNQARIHLIDGGYAPNGLFDPDHKGELRIVPGQMDRLDYFIAELKKRGLYVEISVHGYHWRNVSGETEFPGADLKSMAPFSSGLPLWKPRFVAEEKQFAREFFGHVNPYLGKPYAEEPAVSTLEVLNENGILCAWRGGHMRKAWPAAMVADLQTEWQKFLASRYRDSGRLREAWAAGEIHAEPVDMLKNGGFTDGLKSWGLQVVKPSVGTMEVAAKGGPDGKPCVALSSERSAEKLAFVNLNQTGLTIEKGVRYKLSFFARSEAPAKVSVSVSLNHAPWHSVGLGMSVETGAEWKESTMFFLGSDDDAACKLMIEAPVGTSKVSLAGLSLRKADVIGLPANENLEAGTVGMPLTPQECVDRTPNVASDYADFLLALDARYFDEMREYLVRELHCQHPIKGTQVDQYSSYFSQARYDYLDSHGYWQHPSFPHKPYDRVDWTVGNSPMVNAGEEMAVKLAERRVEGKPFNVSEYCHPAPSTYCAEQVPSIAAIGALQDWDGIVFHCWQEMTYNWRRHEAERLPADRQDSWFNMARHPVKLVTLPFGTLAFRRGDVSPAHGETIVGLTQDEEKRWIMGALWRSWSLDAAANHGMTWRDVLTHRVGLALGSQAAPAMLPENRTRTESDTGELEYDLSDAAAGVLTVNTARSKAVIGFGAGKTFDLGDLTLKPGPTRQKGYSVITASAVQGEDFHSPASRILITATGYVVNKGMVWNAAGTSVGDQWGEGPTLCEGIPFELNLKTSHATAWPLDGHGHRLAPIHGETGPDGVRFVFGPNYRTLWYEIACE
jgi:hypothetical protein